MKDYCELKEIVVHNQEEMNEIPSDFRGRIYIESEYKVIISEHYYHRVVARGNSSVEARENSLVVARGNSFVVASGISSVEAWGNSSVEAWGNSSVVARGNSSVVARGNSSVVAWGNSSVEAWENSSVEARGNSYVEANANVQVVDRQIHGKILLSGNARKVFMPKSIHEFMDFYGIKHDKKNAYFFKAVHKSANGEYYSDWDNDFKYVIGEIKTINCDNDTSESRSYGINMSHLSWALDIGRDWEDIAILEIESKIDDIVMPVNTDGKVRTPRAKILREVPLEECGVFGKILAKRHAVQNT